MACCGGERPAPVEVQGGRERGLILHKLIEEVLTGETEEATPRPQRPRRNPDPRVGTLYRKRSCPGTRPQPELAGCVTRTLALPEVTSLRPGLTPEFPVYASTLTTMAELDRAHQEALRNKGLSLEDLRQRLDA